MSTPAWMREADSSTDDRDTWSIQASWPNAPTRLSTPGFVASHKQLQWYLEDFAAKEPLAGDRAAEARYTLEQYCNSIRSQSAPQVGPGATTKTPTLVDIIAKGSESRLHALPWEALENDSRFVVRRRVETVGSIGITRAVSELSIGNIATFNILLVAARADQDDTAPYGQVAQPLVRILDCLPPGSPSVKLQIARPGTFVALQNHLEDARKRGKPFHLVHFDLHGKVQKKRARLCFTDRVVEGREVAKLLAEHGVTFAVLNACNSAAAHHARPETNLARVLVEEGVPHVLAMSYQLQISTVGTMVTAFYEALLRDQMSFARSAAAARRAMRDEPVRTGRFGLTVEVLDWIVPVVYTSREQDPVVVTTSVVAKATPRRGRFSLRWGSSSGSVPIPVAGALQGRDGDVLELETRLVQNREAGIHHPLLMTGERGCGKTALLRHLTQWWVKTGWMSRVIYVDLESTPAETPEKLREALTRALAGDKSSQDGLMTPAGSTLIIVDHFEVNPPFKLNIAGVSQFAATTELWRRCIEGLSDLPARIIVASYHFPWYIDLAESSTWPWKAYYMLPPPTAEAGFVAGVAGTEKSFRGMLSSRRDCDVFDDISKWAAVHVPLHEAVVALCRTKGVREVSTLLRTNTDLLAVNGFESARIKQSKAYQAARETWKQCNELERAILVGFAPFQGSLPRCIQTYAVIFVLGRLKFRNMVRDHVLRHAPAPSVKQYWAMVNPSTASLVVATLKVLIFKLKKLGLIEAKIALGPAPTPVAENADQLYDTEGTKLYAIHPVFSIFLRHHAAKEGYGRLASSDDEKTLLLTRTFVEYHELRCYEWMEKAMTPGAAQWDTYSEFLLGKSSFTAALEIQLHQSNSMPVDPDSPPAPVFLAWCLMTASGFQSQFTLTRFSPDDLREYCEAAWPGACARVREVARLVLRGSSTPLFLTLSLSVVLQLAVYMSEQYLLQGEMVKLQQCMDTVDGLLASLPVSQDLLCALSPQGFLTELLDLVSALRSIASGEDVCPELGFFELIAKRRPDCAGPGWDAVHKVVSLYRPIAELLQANEQLGLWDGTSPTAAIDGIKDRLDQIAVEDLEPVWDDFLDELDDDTLQDLQLVGFEQAEQVLLTRIRRGLITDMDALDAVRDTQELSAIPSNYISARIRGVQRGQSLAATTAQYQRAHNEWKSQPNMRKARMKLFEDIILRLPDDTTRDFLELSQFRAFTAAGDYESMREYLNLVADGARFATSGGSIDAAQAVRKTRLHNCKAVCGLMLHDYDLAREQLEAAYMTAEDHLPETKRVFFTTLRLYMVLYQRLGADAGASGAIPSIQRIRPYWKILAKAFEMGYEPGDKLYARNGALLAILLQSSTPTPTSSGGGPLVTPGELSTMLSYILPTDHSPIRFLSRLEFLLRRVVESSAADAQQARQVMQEAEVHLLEHGARGWGCGCQFDQERDLYAQRSDEGGMAAVLGRLGTVLPRFDGLDLQIEMPWTSGIESLLRVWMKHVVQKIQGSQRLPTADFAEEDVQAYLAEWHAEMT
ncbi:CHAT domain-containing protein [Microdochium trichocladiopsis]|uniref:CHAT domain-containing protein n=1 Tax=Microdochium trichocladiopsis TaxID=1682393 RepID=A0A9P9BIM1_9PEZI|nr:CHAT domain-containing protein [Microdochium trichocladiopsis]KAH7024383.1 CHAT domain-containing protein [Microdochium trichocladiopsis]